MRISTSPSPINSKIIQKINIQPQTMRSSSLSNTSLFSSKIPQQFQISYVSPYFNSNSNIRYISQEQLHPPVKTQLNEYRNLQNSNQIEINLRKLSQRVQIIEKKLKKQRIDDTKSRKTEQQKILYMTLQQKIQKQLQQKNAHNNQKIFNEIKKIEEQIKEKFQIMRRKYDFNQVQNKNFEQRSYKTSQLQINQKGCLKFIEEKIKQEIFKIQIHFQNQINKNLSLIKNNSSEGRAVSIVSKSKLKYKYAPILISIRNQVSTSLNENQRKKKQTLSTAHSTGSSQQQQRKLPKKIIQIDQQKYYIDKQGYLLDVNGFYLLNDDQKMIRIDKNLIKKLKQLRIIG